MVTHAGEGVHVDAADVDVAEVVPSLLDAVEVAPDCVSDMTPAAVTTKITVTVKMAT
jgi:hypothetical protein